MINYAVVSCVADFSFHLCRKADLLPRQQTAASPLASPQPISMLNMPLLSDGCPMTTTGTSWSNSVDLSSGLAVSIHNEGLQALTCFPRLRIHSMLNCKSSTHRPADSLHTSWLFKPETVRRAGVSSTTCWCILGEWFFLYHVFITLFTITTTTH